MENMPTESKGEESKILQHVEILGSVGEVRERDGKIFWFMNGTEKEPHETEPVLPIIESAVAKAIQAGKSGDIDHIRISPAVALHLILEGVLDPEQVKSTPATDTTLTPPPYAGNYSIPFIIEQRMLQNRNGSDIIVMDKNDRSL